MDGARERPAAIGAESLPTRAGSAYPEPFTALVAARVSVRQARTRQAHCDVFGLTPSGVDRTRLPPGTRSTLRHAHSRQDEFVFVLEGAPTRFTDAGEAAWHPGMFAGFAAGTNGAHPPVTHGTRSTRSISRSAAGGEVSYPDGGLLVRLVDGCQRFFHQDGQPYRVRTAPPK